MGSWKAAGSTWPTGRGRKASSLRCELNPLGLVFKGGVAYLVCTFWQYTDVRQVVLHRVHRAEVLEAPAIVPEGFDLDRYIQEGEFSYPVGEPIRLEAVFSHGAAFHLHDTPLSADQVLTELDHERVLLRATVENTAELRWWLLGFGELVEVLAPADLRERVPRASGGDGGPVSTAPLVNRHASTGPTLAMSRS